MYNSPRKWKRREKNICVFICIADFVARFPGVYSSNMAIANVAAVIYVPGFFVDDIR